VSGLSYATIAAAWAPLGVVTYPFVRRFHEQGAGTRTDERALAAVVLHPVGLVVLVVTFLVTAAVVVGPLVAAAAVPFAGAAALDPYLLVGALVLGYGAGSVLAHRFRGPVERVVQPSLSALLE